MDYSEIFGFGIAIGLGFLIGIQRESEDEEIAGVRTFTFIALLGAISGKISAVTEQYSIIAVFAGALAVLLVISNYIQYKQNPAHSVGLTTELAVLLTFAIGAYIMVGDRLIAVIMGAVLTVLLHVKERLHTTIDRMERKDFNAIMTFVGISLIILPILPDKSFDQYEVVNPKEIWLIVVLIVGISIAGYFIYKLLGKKVGVISNGILGGLISSTATTVSYAKFAKQSKPMAKLAVFVILTASMISVIRVIVEIGIVAPAQLMEMIWPFAALAGVMTILCVIMYIIINQKTGDTAVPEPENPSQFKSALIFGLLYGVILFVVAFVKEKLGNNALLAVSILSGLTDVDAITLSLAKLVKQGNLETDTGWKYMTVGILSNMTFKGIMAYVIGGKVIAKWILINFGVILVAGILIILLWP